MPEKKCPKCGETQPTEAFYINERHSDGLSSSCRACLIEYSKRRDARLRAERDLAQSTPSQKICKTCALAKPIEDFAACARYKDGLNTQCRECISAKYKEWEAQRNGRPTLAQVMAAPVVYEAPRPAQRPIAPTLARTIATNLCHKADKFVTLLQYHRHHTVWMYGTPTMEIDGLTFEICPKALVMGSDEIPYDVSAVERAISARRTSSCASSADPSVDVTKP